MNPSNFWKNFNLGDELSISGVFIYNGLRRYHEMKTLDYTEELFEFLYNLSVGIERLLKIAVVLHEHTDTANQEYLERSLITHNHLDLLARLRKHTKLTLGEPQIDLLNMLGKFYKTLRYDRFSLASAYNARQERKAICSWLKKHLEVSFPDDASYMPIYNDDRYRKFVRRAALAISKMLYQVIKDRAERIKLYTYEVRHGSKAESVFIRGVDISDEDVLWKELLIYFMNTKSASGYLNFLRGIEPLEFDPGLVGEYLEAFQADSGKAFISDELEHLYSEMKEKARKRLEIIRMIGAPNIIFTSEDDEIEEEFE